MEDERSSTICTLTDDYCVGVNVDYKWKALSFGENEMRRCPMYNLDFKRIFRKKLSSKIRPAREALDLMTDHKEMVWIHSL